MNLLRQKVEILLRFIGYVCSVFCIAPCVLLIPFTFTFCGNTAAIFIEIIGFFTSYSLERRQEDSTFYGFRESLEESQHCFHKIS
jgi:hypothetical protein